MSKELQFENLCLQVKSCTLCPRMCDSQRILSYSSGPLDAKLMFIGEAPGRLGADDTGIPFHGDRAGNNFENFLNQVGINRYDIFITNAVLCNPRDEKGNNSTPILDEIKNCSSFLKQQIDLINPKIIVTLGATPLKSLNLIENHDLQLKSSVRNSFNWYGRKLFPLYHPGQRALLHRSFHNQLSDYQHLSEEFKRLNSKPRKKYYGKTRYDVASIVDFITSVKSELTYFGLHKIMFLAEYESMKRTNTRLTNAFFIRQKDGPYCTDLHYSKLKNTFSDIKIIGSGPKLRVVRNSTLDLFTYANDFNLDLDTQELLINIIEKHGNKDNFELKRSTYLTKPMKEILRKEKYEHINLFNTPVEIYS